MAEAHRGVQGFVMDETNNPVEKASLKIKSRDVGFQTTKYGEFWRILLPGRYKLEVYAEGYQPKEVEFMVIDSHPTLLNVTLYPAKVNILHFIFLSPLYLYLHYYYHTVHRKTTIITKQGTFYLLTNTKIVHIIVGVARLLGVARRFEDSSPKYDDNMLG